MSSVPPAHDIFISLRFTEALPAALAIRSSLQKKSVSVFVCEVPPGDDIATTVMDRLHNCRMVIIMGTVTYGKKTAAKFSTFEELRFVIEEEKPFYLVKMCDVFAEHKTRFWLPSTVSYRQWQPDMDDVMVVPDDLVKDIMDKLPTVPGPPCSSLSSSSSSQARAAGGIVVSHSAPVTSTATAISSTAVPVAAPSSCHTEELIQLLHQLQFNDMAAPLSAIGVTTMDYLKLGLEKKYFTSDVLKQHGAIHMRACIFMDEVTKECKRRQEEEERRQKEELEETRRQKEETINRQKEEAIKRLKDEELKRQQVRIKPKLSSCIPLNLYPSSSAY